MDKTEITILPDPALADLGRRIEKSGSQKAAADELNISPAYLNDVLQGRRDISVNLLEKLGHKKIVVHVPDARADVIVRAIEAAMREADHVIGLRTEYLPKIGRTKIKTGAKS